ncbi:hypothetical protein GLOTRDRAFT_133077 [Gloeophyllum trabeum ATCC 11539]|uniref:Uncharacterized protein n=1 Tax=Gloeophyllum trabeum (strain ATCC 11539 / FP-39264 / Madison 617) TaxID=670483 RepID=S7PV14_GLOTA|nr:uncharacterized protein GLOTRDRAFT_133077 [Gloeophyllum trabeum ATCC 11539]EPQ51197.1 hypothetical protein GLOTRDRAFT_133077 [Gloeophyllum trabeum ATCC 11539]
MRVFTLAIAFASIVALAMAKPLDNANGLLARDANPEADPSESDIAVMKAK